MNVPLSESQQRVLLDLARAQVEHVIRVSQRVTVSEQDPRLDDQLRAYGAAFVTLRNRGRLRGCIGSIVAHEPLYCSVLGNAANACKDSRFVRNPIVAAELAEIDIEISVLSPPRRIRSGDEVVVGRDGVILTLGSHRGVFLPQVAQEQGWNRVQYLENLGRKAGAAADAWKDPQAVLEVFTAQVVGEPHPGPDPR
jgi:AmmeMemoRadiSam system protein A